MNRATSIIIKVTFSACVSVGLAPRLDAQLVSASAASLALGDNYTALARGINAVAWNPAGLGMPDNPFVSFAFAGRGAAGTDPISLSEDRKSTRLNSSHPSISYAVFCLKKKKKNKRGEQIQRR